jgi:hypothetical protein
MSQLTEEQIVKYAPINKKRWLLAKKLVENFSARIIPLYPFYRNNEKAGKVPCIRGWVKKEPTTIEELEEWQREWEYCNIGLVLGGFSGWVAIDVDGEGGRKILKELSGGDIPDTVTYKTPGGGKRYLYKVKDEHIGKKFKKYVKTGEGEHCECALLGDGQQTVLPYSIHPNGGEYRFYKGKNFDTIKVAFTPEWMEDLMLQTTKNKKEDKRREKGN